MTAHRPVQPKIPRKINKKHTKELHNCLLAALYIINAASEEQIETIFSFWRLSPQNRGTRGVLSEK